MSTIELYRGDTFREDWRITDPLKKRVEIRGAPTGGAITLGYDGSTTAPIAYDAAASAVETALLATAALGSGDVTVSGGPGPGTPWLVEFGGEVTTGTIKPLVAASQLVGGFDVALVVLPGAYDLAGVTLWWTLKASKADADPGLLQHKTGVGTAIDVTDAEDGRAVHTITAAESAALPTGVDLVWDVQLKAADGTVRTLEMGVLRVFEDVTLATS